MAKDKEKTSPSFSQASLLKELRQKLKEFRQNNSVTQQSDDGDLVKVPNVLTHSIFPEFSTKKDDLCFKIGDRNLSPEDAECIYDILNQTWAEELNLLGRKRISDDLKTLVVENLANNGYSFSTDDFSDIIRVARKIRNNRKKEECDISTYRQASLNNYDYERLKAEYSELSCVTGESTSECLPVLSSIIREAKSGEDDDYPGRHLDFSNIKGRTAWRYQCLRIMDEKLYTTETAVSDDEMSDYIIDKANKLGILIDNAKTSNLNNRLAKNYVILDQLISVEHNAGCRQDYESNVYCRGRRGHIYNTVSPDSHERVTAFKVVYTYYEAIAIKKELEAVIAKFFNGDIEKFSENYPLLASLYNFDKIIESHLANKQKTNKYYDAIVVNYLPVDKAELKKTIENVIATGQTITIRENGIETNFRPIKINKKGRKWALLAKDVATRVLSQITPERLANATLNATKWIFDANDDEESFEDGIIGLGSLYDGTPKKVTLSLTQRNTEIDIVRNSMLFKQLKPVTTDSYIKRNNYEDSGTEFLTIICTVYINDDFFKEVFDFDTNGHLIDIGPDDVRSSYASYFERRSGKKKWIPYQDRPLTNKVIKAGKRGMKE
ncbi:MAG: hypothetical protein NC339_06775 [Muribaculaceae bacterium]|nr:hypothetical protein [Muribaculaceae bacterium]